jgi:hypothetical protein
MQSIYRCVRILAGTLIIFATSAGAFGQRGRMSGYPPTMGNLPIVKPSRPVLPLPSQAGLGWRNRVDSGHGSAVPYAVPYPVYIGSGDVGPTPPNNDAGDDGSYADEASDAFSGGIAPQPSPVTIDPGPAAIEPNGCQFPISPPPSEYTNIFFIALNDGSVHTAIAYWTEATTLHYMTPEYIHNQVSLALVDQKTSAALNSNQSVPLAPP